MYHKGYIIPGIIIFVALFTWPLWSQMGKAAPVPQPELPKKHKACVMDKDYMRTSHMQLLNDWRNSVVREADRIFTGANGQQFNMSLSNECMRCHDDKAKFCDRCHNYTGVAPYCWECHMVPPAAKESN